MSGVHARLPIVFVGALLISLVLGASAVKVQQRPAGTGTAAAVALVSTSPAPPSASPTSTPSASPSPTATPTATRTATRAPSLTPSPTRTLSPTASPTPTALPTDTPSPTPWPTPDAEARTREVRVPILMYHHVGPLPADPDRIRIGLTILPDYFETQLEFLRKRGYQSIDLYQMQYALALGWPLPPKPIVFTFDDAYDDVHQYAFPLMQRYGFTGTVFVPTQFLDEGRDGYLSWDQALDLFRAGWRLEPHTKTHDSLQGRGREFQFYQIFGSMETLRHHLGYQPRFFAYPAGQYDDTTIEVLKEVGYWGAVTTGSGQYHRLATAYKMGRVRVSGFEVLADLANRLGEKFP